MRQQSLEVHIGEIALDGVANALRENDLSALLARELAPHLVARARELRGEGEPAEQIATAIVKEIKR